MDAYKFAQHLDHHPITQPLLAWQYLSVAALSYRFLRRNSDDMTTHLESDKRGLIYPDARKQIWMTWYWLCITSVVSFLPLHSFETSKILPSYHSRKRLNVTDVCSKRLRMPCSPDTRSVVPSSDTNCTSCMFGLLKLAAMGKQVMEDTLAVIDNTRGIGVNNPLANLVLTPCFHLQIINFNIAKVIKETNSPIIVRFLYVYLLQYIFPPSTTLFYHVKMTSHPIALHFSIHSCCFAFPNEQSSFQTLAYACQQCQVLVVTSHSLFTKHDRRPHPSPNASH